MDLVIFLNRNYLSDGFFFELKPAFTQIKPSEYVPKKPITNKRNYL